jgi:tetratricopeptide (TPR) repeat protein
MLELPLRQVATLLLESAIRIAPPDTREWGEAMRGELSYVDGQWAGLMWAFGGAGMMVKYALISIFIPGRGQGIPPGDELFAKSVSLGKTALVGGAGCILAALLFFGAPPFRQAFRVALRPWYFMFQIASGDPQHGFEALAKRAQSQHDPEGLAFCAVRIENSRESARLAEEAVRLNPNLLWVYAVVGMRYPELPQIGPWMARLEQWDAQNSLFHLIEAQSVDLAHFGPGARTPPSREQDEAWRTAMSAVFRSPRFDDYLDRVAELNRKVIPRYGFYDPYEVESRDQLDLPVTAFDNSERFAKSLLRTGEDLEARGDRKGALEKYWTVAHFGQVIDSQGRTGFEHLIGTSLQAMAYKQLQAFSVKGGNQADAALFAYLAAKFDPLSGEHPGFPGESAFGLDTAKRNAAVVQISGLMILVFSGLLVIAAAILLIGGSASRRTPSAAQRAKPVATLILSSSAVGLLFSSVTLYLTYRPYWYIFQSAVLNGGRSQARDLIYFLNETKLPAGVSPRAYLLLHSLVYSGSPNFLFYVWTGVTLLGLIGLALILLRHFLSRPRVNRLQNHPRVP